MKKIDTPVAYVHLNPSPFPAHVCSSCGSDPVDVYDGHDIVGTAPLWAIDAKGQLCLACAEVSAAYLAHHYDLTWRTRP